MAISLTENRKKQKNLIFVLMAVVAVIAIVIWWGYFREETATGVVNSPQPRKEVKIDFDFLKSAKLSALQIFEKIPAFTASAGRQNPFLPY